MNKKILFVCPYPENVAPSQRLKFEQYYPYFREEGYEVEVDSFISKSFWKIVYSPGFFFKKSIHTILGYWRRFFLLFTLRNYDVVYIHLWVTPFGAPIFEWLYRTVSKKMIYDIDDLIYLGNTQNISNRIVTILKGRRKPIYLMKTADHVITCTPYLDQFVRRYNDHTTDISSTINTNLYRPKTCYDVKGKFVIGWSGSHSTSKYLHLLDDVFKELARKYLFKLVVMGDAGFTLNGVEIEAVPWNEKYEVEVISRFDIGVYPLPKEEWVLGKSGLKALQYMALGIPTVATDIGTIHRIIRHGENGFLVSSEEGWKNTIVKLLNDQSLRKKTGIQASVTVEEIYSINANKEKYLRILNLLTNY